MAKLFEPFSLRGIKLKNRIGVSPMCQYSCNDGSPTAWHMVHLGSRAVGGAGLVMIEATGVNAEGRISPGDAGIWNDTQANAWMPIVQFIKEQGAASAMQLAHAGRKASTGRPWDNESIVSLDKGGWVPVAPSAIAFDKKGPTPKEMNETDIAKVILDFKSATLRALRVGLDIVEIHSAHGYLLHEFLSPLSNQRQDNYGGSFENRIRLLCEVTETVRKVWSDNKPLLVRISATDWADGGWDN